MKESTELLDEITVGDQDGREANDGPVKGSNEDFGVRGKRPWLRPCFRRRLDFVMSRVIDTVPKMDR